MGCPSCGADGTVTSGRFCGSCGALLTSQTSPRSSEPDRHEQAPARARPRTSGHVLLALSTVVALVLATVAAQGVAPASDGPDAGGREAEADSFGELPPVPMPGSGDVEPVERRRELTLLCAPELEEAPEQIVRQMMKAGAATRVDGAVCLVVPRPRTAVPQAQCIQLLRWSCVVP